MAKDRRLGRGLAALLGTPVNEEEGGDYASLAADQLAESGGPYLEPGSDPDGSDHSDHSDHSDGPRPQTPAGRQRSAVPEPAGPDSGDQGGEGLLHLEVGQIDDNPFQPRRDFSEPEIVSLAESLKEHDMLQPVLVRRLGDRYQLISGERRLRAAIRAGWSRIPARIREADDRLVAELAIVENLQRKDLNAVEKALSFKRYLDEHGCTQDDLARRLKLDRSTIANLMRLLELPAPVLDALRGGAVSAGHARALLPLGDEPEQIAFCQRIQREGLSVRDVERQVQEQIQQEDGEPLGATTAKARRKRARNEQVAALEQELRLALGTRIDIRQTSNGRGRIVVHFSSHAEFERLHEILTDTGPAADRQAG